MRLAKNYWDNKIVILHAEIAELLLAVGFGTCIGVAICASWTIFLRRLAAKQNQPIQASGVKR